MEVWLETRDRVKKRKRVHFSPITESATYRRYYLRYVV